MFPGDCLKLAIFLSAEQPSSRPGIMSEFRLRNRISASAITVQILLGERTSVA